MLPIADPQAEAHGSIEKNKPLTISFFHFQSHPRGSKLHCISGEIHARIYPLDKSGKSQQQYIIEALTQSNIVNLDGLKEIYPELKRQGNNLNQIAKKLNENGYVDYKQELPNTMKEVREVWQLLKQYLQKQA